MPLTRFAGGCGGPDRPSKEKIDLVYNRILEILNKEFKVFNYPPPNYEGFIKSRKTAEKQLKDAIEEVLWQENCESW